MSSRPPTGYRSVERNYLAITVATVVALVIGAVWHGALASRMTGLHVALILGLWR